MRYRHLLVSAAVTLAIALPSCAADSTPVVQNAQVRVTEDTLQPSQSQTLSDHLPSVIVSLEDGNAAIGTKDAPVHRGETLFVPADTKDIRNTGTQPLHFVRVAFLDGGSSDVWRMSGLPSNYKMVLENRYTRVYDIKIPAHFQEPQHTHHGRVVICLSGATLEHVLPDGHTQPSTLKTGEVVWRPGQTHVGHNIGNTALWAIAVEPK